MDSPERGYLGLTALIVGIVQSGVWLAIGVAGVITASKFQKIFADFDAKLPARTQVVLNVAVFAKNFWPIAIVAVLLWPGVVWGVDWLLSQSGEAMILRLMWLIATSLAFLMAIVLFVVSMFMPLISLSKKLGGG